MLLRAACINVPRKIGLHAQWRCFGLAMRAGDIFGENEVFDRDHKRLNKRLARKKGLGQYGTSKGPNPVYWSKAKYQRVSARQVRLHPAGTGWRARRWPGYNAARFVTEVVLQPVDGGSEVAVLNTHWVPRGPKVPARWRTQMRRRSKKRVRAMIADHRGAGRVVLVMGDFNIGGGFSLPPVSWLAARGVDKIGLALPGNLRARRRTSRPFVAPTDHRHGIAASVEITRRSTS